MSGNENLDIIIVRGGNDSPITLLSENFRLSLKSDGKCRFGYNVIERVLLTSQNLYRKERCAQNKDENRRFIDSDGLGQRIHRFGGIYREKAHFIGKPYR